MRLKIIQTRDKEDKTKFYDNVVLFLPNGFVIPIKESFENKRQVLWFLGRCEVDVVLHQKAKKEGDKYDNFYLVLTHSNNYVALDIKTIFDKDYRLLKAFCVVDG